MRQFFKFLFASFFGGLLAIVCGVFLLFAIGAGIASMSEKEVVIEENTLLTPDFSKRITERKIDDPFSNLGMNGNFQSSSGLALTSITKALKEAKTDDRIKGLFLDMTIFQGGRSSLHTVKKALEDFKTSGKPIYAYADYYTESTYYLASLADSIYMQPAGMFSFDGASMEMMFFRTMFEKLDIEPRVFKHGKYKSAGEPFSETKMSKANREQMHELMQSLYTQYLANVSENRGIDSATLRAIATELKIREPEDAKNLGLIDGLVYRDEVMAKLAQLMGEDKYADINKVGIGSYASSINDEYNSDKVGVVYAVGPINMGEGDDENIGATRISAALRKARLDDKVKAVVLRVNSPGGSALASDVILREVELIKEAGKPIVVSMGDVAASGGYYIACKADEIIAQPNTITGSIGVIGFIPGTEKFFENKLGITYDRIKTGPYADLGNPNRPMSDDERSIIQNSLDVIYDDFVGHVSQGRGITKEMVDSLGRGRVWTGEQAIERKLVDRLGSLDDAIASAASRASLEGYEIKEFPKAKNAFEELVKGLGGNVKARIIESEMGAEPYKIYKQVKWLSEFDEPLMLMPYQIY